MELTQPQGSTGFSPYFGSPQTVQSFAQELQQAGLGDYAPVLGAVNNGLQAFTAPASLYSRPEASTFEDQATQQVSPYYDKNLQLALEKIDLAKNQAKQTKDLQDQQAQQTQQQYHQQEDYNFAQALRGAQNGFAGKGTYTSGARNLGIGQLHTGEEQKIANFDLPQAQAQGARDLGFSQFLDTNALDRKIAEEQGLQGKNAAILGQEQSFQNQDTQRKQAAINVYNRGFSQFLNSNQPVAA